MFGQRGGREAVKSHCGSDCSGRPCVPTVEEIMRQKWGGKGKQNLLLSLPLLQVMMGYHTPQFGHWGLGFCFGPWRSSSDLCPWISPWIHGSDHSQKPIKRLQSVNIILCGWFVLQIQEFSSGFWTGSQLACWDRTEKPWSLFPKLSIYLRDENSSRSFRISILPQVSTFFVYSSVHLFLLL